MVEQAKLYAIKAHGDQKYGDKPYIVHLEEVVSHLINYSNDVHTVGYLHDILEDTDISYKEIRDIFGEFIADCVSIVTDEPGSSRNERKKKTYVKMANVQGLLEVALIVKAADRLANIQASVKGNNAKMLAMYKSEHSVFTTSVYRPELCDDLWKKITKALSTS